MKNFILKTTHLSLPVLLFLLLINYFGDAARLFDNDYELEMVKILTDGRNVTNIENYDERLFQKALISNENIRPSLVVIGSSRTILLNSELFSDSSFLNSSVSGATIEDVVSIYQLYKSNDKLPQKIIIGIDPWIFNENNGQKRWQSLSTYYYSFKDSINQERSKYHNSNYFKYKELFSLSYFQSSIKLMPRLLTRESKPQASTDKYNDLGTKLTDGSFVYSKAYRDASPLKIEERMKSYLTGDIYSIENFNGISVSIWTEFERLITDMKKNGVEVEFFLAPYAPMVFDVLQTKYPMVIKTEEAIKSFSRSNNINLYGSFDPEKLGMDETFFYDGMHCKEIGIERIIEMKN